MLAIAFNRLYHTILLRQEGDVFPYKSLALCCKYFIVLWEQYISYRQYRNLCSKLLPETLKGYVSEEQFQKAQAYGRDKLRFSFAKAFFLLALETLWLTRNILPWLWDLSRIIQSLIFFQLKTIIEVLIEQPFTLYMTFVIEVKHGFNKQNIRLFMRDLITLTLAKAIIETPFYAGLIKVIKIGVPTFYIYAWLFIAIFHLLLTIVYPTLIVPLFNKFALLPKNELYAMIEALMRRVQFPMHKLYVMDGSKRSGHSNAYFYGFFKIKRIVIFDTLLDHLNNDETCAVLAHELGHWNYGHSFALLASSLFEIFIAFFLFSRVTNSRGVFKSFGFADSAPTLVGYILFEYLYTPISKITDFARKASSRYYEFVADAFACDLGYGASLSSGLIKLQLKNLGFMNPDWLYSMYNMNHPELVERLNAIKYRRVVSSKSDKLD
ncbi:CAAX prenyl protease 1 [Linnemannia zychae]|nr:CAAX prenyl protease 1 [Linnemannia zychae]